MYYIFKCIVQGKQARVKNAHFRHPSCTVVMLKRKSASPVLSVLRTRTVSSKQPANELLQCGNNSQHGQTESKQTC